MLYNFYRSTRTCNINQHKHLTTTLFSKNLESNLLLEYSGQNDFFT